MVGREQKHQHAADSESTSSGLLSPRDKPTRKEMLRREEARKQRAADERTNGNVARLHGLVVWRAVLSVLYE